MGTTLEEFTLFSLFRCAELNSSKQLAKKALAGILFLVSAVSSIWCSEYIYNENCESTEVYDFSSGIIAGNSEFVWKKLNAAGTAWSYLTTPETPGASDNLYFTGELAANIKLDADVTVNEIIFSYERTANPNVTSGSYTITIDLNGYNLTCNDFIFNNASTYPANVVIKDSSGSPGTLTINGTLDYSDNLDHTLTISDDVAIDASGATYSAGIGTGGLTVSGTGSLELPVGTSDSNLSITGVSTNIITVACTISNTTRSAFTAAQKSTITLSCSEASHLEVPISYEIKIVTPLDTNPPSFKLSGVAISNGTNSGTITFSQDVTSQDFDVTYTGTFSESDSIYITIKHGSDILAQSSIVPDNPYWTGSVNTAWNNVANWVGLTSIADLATASEIYIPAEASRAPSVTGGDLTAGSGTTEFYIGKNISSSGSMTFNGSIILNGDITLTSSEAMTFNGSINSTPSAAASSLILDAGAQITVNNGPIGSTNPIGDLTVKHNYKSTGDSPITCSGALVFEEPCLFTSDMTAASFSIGGECTLSSTGSLLTITTTSGNQSFAGEVLLLSDVKLVTPNNGTVTFTGNVESHASHQSSLTVGNTTGTSKTNLSVATSCGNTRPLNNLYVSGTFSAGDVKVDGDFTSKNSTSVSSIIVGGNSTVGGTVSATGTAGITFTGDVTLTDDTTFSAGSNGITFSSDVDSDGNSLTIGSSTDAAAVTFAGDVIHTSTLTLYGNTTFSGSITVNVNNWANPSSKTITPGTSTVTVKDSITGSNNFYNLTTTGTALAFEAGKTQTISGTFTADGTSLESSTAGTQWTIDVASANAVVSNVSVKDSDSVNLITPTGTNANLGNNINWDISSSYRWKAAASSTAWTTASNWELNTGSSWITATRYPGQDAADTVTIPAATNSPAYSGSSDITLLKITVGSATDSDAGLTLSGSGSILLSAASNALLNYGTVFYESTGRIKNNAATPALIMDVARGTVQYNAGAVSVSDIGTTDYYNLIINGTGHTLAGAITVANNFTLKNSSSIVTAAGSSLTVTGASSLGGSITTAGNQVYAEAVTLTANSALDADTSNITFSAAISGADKNLTVTGAGASFAAVTNINTLTLNAASTLGANVSVKNWANPSSTTITPGTSTVTVSESVSGDNNFYNLTVSDGATVSFEAGKTQTISGTFTAGGTTGSVLQSSVNGTQWNISVASANASVSNVSVKDSNSVNVITPTGTNVNLGNNINWDIGSSYRWIGGTSSAWMTAANWQMKTTGTTWIQATSYPGQFSSSDDVLVGSANKTTNWPDFSGTTDIHITKIQIGDSSTDTTSQFNFSASADLIASDATPITNYGTIIFESSGRFKNTAATPALIMDAAHGTVQFNSGATVISEIGTADYYNLIIDGTGHTLGGAITVANNFTLKTSSSITGGTSLSVTKTSSIGGNITTTGAQSYTGIVTATADCAFTSSGGNVTFSNKIEATGYNVASSTNGSSVSTTIRGNITAANFDVTGILNFGQNLRTITTTGSQNYRGPAKINSANASQTLTLTAAGGVTFYDTLTRFNNTTTTAVLYTAGTTNVVFKKNISDLAEISIDGTTTFESTVSSVSSTGAQTYTEAVTYASDITFAAGTDSTTDISFASSFTDSSATPHNLTVNKGNFKIGTSTFTAGVVTVDSAGAFTQTGDNGTNTQSALALINNGTMIWDSTGAGGTLSVTGTATDGGISSPDGTDYTDHLIVFNKKNVNISNDNTISGVFYNLTIPTGKTYTNGLEIVVRNNFTATGTYAHNSKTLRFGDTKVGSVTYPNGDDGIITGTESGTPSTLYLGNILIRQGNKTKTFKSNISTANITCGDTTTGGSIIFEKNLTVNGTPSLTTKGSYIFNSTADGTTVNFTNNVSITNAAKVTVGKNFTSSGNITINAPVSLSANTTFTATGKNIAFGDTVSKDTTSSTLTVTTGTGTSSQVTFTKAVNVQQLTVTNYGTFNLKKAASITAPAGFTLYGNGNAVIGEDSDTTALSITTTNTQILFDGTGTVTLNGTGLKTFSTSNSDGGNITINKAIAGSANNSQPLALTAGTGTGAGNITLSNNIGTTTIALGNLTLTGKNITLDSGKKIYARSVSITNTGLFHLQSAASITAGSGFTTTGTGLSQLNGTIATTNSAISFNTDTYISGTSTLNAESGTITIGNGTAGDLYISSISGTTAQNVSFTAGTLDVKGNFALFNGNVTLAANLTTGKDIVLLNGASSTMNDDTHDTNKSSGITGLFNYHNALRTASNKLCPPSLALATTSGYPETMPDGVTSITHTGTYRSTMSGFAGKTITAGQNFYDNGVNLSPTAAWTLKLKDNDSAVNAFAEAYNATISYCSVACITTNGYAWLSASENCTDGGSNSNDTSATLTYTPGVTTGAYTRTKTGVAFLHPVMLENNPSNSASEGRKTGPEIPNLSGTYSVRDNVIRIEFVRSNNHNKSALIENSNNEISRALATSGVIKVNSSSDTFTAAAYIDAECTESTDGKGDLAVIYIQASSITWNLSATGTNPGASTDLDSHGNHQTNCTDLSIERALATLFYTLTDEHKNRISEYKNNPSSNPNANEGFRFTATATRCAVAEMHICFTVADFTSNKIYLYFDQPLDDNITWASYHPGTADDQKTESAIKIITTPGSATYVNNPVTSVSRSGISPNGIILTLQNNLSYSMLEYGIVIKYGGSFLFDNKIHSPDNHVVEDGESHCISDVITSCIDVQYAYDNRNDAYIDFTGGTAPADSIVMRDFTGEGKHNKVFAEKNITLVTKDVAPADGTSAAANFKYKLVADINPTAHSDGDTFESISGHKTRFWFGEGTNPVTGFSPFLNTSSDIRNSSDNSDVITQSVDATDPTIIKYLFKNFPEETPCLNWPKGSDVRFTFEVLKSSGASYTINHKYDAAATQSTPLYAVRLKNALDISTIDLWSFKMAEPQRQRGGVTVYSNVINATNKEFCTVEVNMPSTGSLRVIIMTADGNVVKYLENGRKPQGLHYYYWDGTNNSGTAVARGIYFIRVVGPEMEETRKVMVVK